MTPGTTSVTHASASAAGSLGKQHTHPWKLIKNAVLTLDPTPSLPNEKLQGQGQSSVFN